MAQGSTGEPTRELLRGKKQGQAPHPDSSTSTSCPAVGLKSSAVSRNLFDLEEAVILASTQILVCNTNGSNHSAPQGWDS